VKFEIAISWEERRAKAHARWDDMWPWLEVNERSDIVIARPQKDTAIVDMQGPVVPLELKTTGTWWNDVSKALGPLLRDMRECAAATREPNQPGCRTASPFAAVAILITHVDWDNPGTIRARASLDEMCRAACAHGEAVGLELASTTRIKDVRVGTGSGLEHSGNGGASACQLV